MSFLENAKQYTGSDLENIFFRPILSGPSAGELGVRVLYNMPVPTTIQLWSSRNTPPQGGPGAAPPTNCRKPSL